MGDMTSKKRMEAGVIAMAVVGGVMVAYSLRMFKDQGYNQASFHRDVESDFESVFDAELDPNHDEGPAAIKGPIDLPLTHPDVNLWPYSDSWHPLTDVDWPKDYSQKVPDGYCCISEEEFLLKPHPNTVKRVEKFESVPKEMIVFNVSMRSRLEMPRHLSGPKIKAENWFPQFTSAYLLNIQNGFIGDNSIFGPSTKGAEKYYMSLSRWWNGYPRAYYGSAQGIEHVNLSRAVSVGGWGATAFQHFVIDVLPKLALIYPMFISEKWKKANVSLVTTLGRSPAPRWFLEQLGIWNRTIQMMGWPKKAKFIYRVSEALYPDFAPAPLLLRKGRIGIYPRGVLRPIQKALGVLDEVRRDRIVFMFRGGRRSIKKTLRGDLVRGTSELVKKYNKEKGANILVERFAFTTREEARAQFSRALIMIGPHGGALSNMVFARPGTYVVEFIPMYNFTQKGTKERSSKYVYYGLSQACGHQYWYVPSPNFNFDRGGMEINVTEVLEIVKLVLSRPLPK